MIYAYDKVYLRIAQRSLGEMLRKTVNDLRYELKNLYLRILQSEYSLKFSKVYIFVITEIFVILLYYILDEKLIKLAYNTANSQEYWT